MNLSLRSYVAAGWLFLVASVSLFGRGSFPAASRGDTVDTYFGQKVADPYRWLEEIDSPSTKSWIEEENKFTNEILSKIPEREAIRTRLKSLWNFPAFGVPFKEGGHYFYSKNSGLQDQSVMYMRPSIGQPERIILDPNTLSSDGTVALTLSAPSPDGKWFGYGLAVGGSDWTELHVRSIETGKDTEDLVKWVKFSEVNWTRDSKGFFYGRYPEISQGDKLFGKLLNQEIYYHRLGTPQAQDRKIFSLPEHPDWFISANITDDGRYLVLSVQQNGEIENAIMVLDLKNPTEPDLTSPVRKMSDKFDASYRVLGNVGSRFFVFTDLHASNGKVISIDLEDPAPANWREVVPESKDTIDDVQFIGGKFVIAYMHNVTSTLKIQDIDGKKTQEVILPGIGAIGGIQGHSNDSEFFFSFSSFLAPVEIFRCDTESLHPETFQSAKVAFAAEDYVTEQVFYSSKDGTKVPMFVTHKKNLKRDGTVPTLLYGYGGFDIAVRPSFSIPVLVWLEMGGIYAEANLRGGSEYGEKWHLAGTKERKQNVFDDYISAAEFLFKEKYTRPEHLALYGRSNGGLLIGATVNQRPDLCAVAFPTVGVMDMLRFHKFTIGAAWVSDYGSSDDAAGFKYLRAYSPLHNVKKGTKYPAMLITTGDHDDRVFPAHSFKYAAAMQAATRGSQPVLIRIDSKAGHGGSSGSAPVSKTIDEWTDRLSFAGSILKMHLQNY